MSAPAPGTARVLVTGAGSGIGRAVVERLVREGGRVVATGRRADRLQDLERAHPGSVVALPCDVTDLESRERLLDAAKDALGGLDGLVHSAGEVVHQQPGHITEKALRSQLEVNLVAPLRLGEQALDLLDSGGGVVFVSSTLALRPVRTSAVYSAAKAGMIAFTKALALEGAARKVRVNAVCPGIVDTGMIRELRQPPGEPALAAEARARRVEQQLETMRGLHPLGRLGTAEDVAESVHYLLGAPWVTGTILTVDGGLLLRE